VGVGLKMTSCFLVFIWQGVEGGFVKIPDIFFRASKISGTCLPQADDVENCLLPLGLLRDVTILCASLQFSVFSVWKRLVAFIKIN